jgi:hypothetical protein
MDMNFNFNKTITYFLIITNLFIGCNCEKGKHEHKANESAVNVEKVNAPAFNSDSSYVFIKTQVDFGPRVPNTTSHDACGDYLIKKLESFGLKAKTQKFEAKTFDGKKLNLTNIIGSYNPDAATRILLTAHWDTRPFADQDSVNKNKPIDGANDGASGVGILLEVARAIHAAKLKPNVGVDIIFFDGEDYGATEDFEGNHQDTYCLGSQYWAKNKENYSAFFGILLDMAGAKGAKFAKEGISMQYAPSIVELVWNTGNGLGYGNHFIDFKSSAITDDHFYINSIAQIPTIDIIEYDPNGSSYFGSYWHTHKDTMEVIDKETLKAVGQTLLEVIYNTHKQLI